MHAGVFSWGIVGRPPHYRDSQCVFIRLVGAAFELGFADIPKEISQLLRTAEQATTEHASSAWRFSSAEIGSEFMVFQYTAKQRIGIDSLGDFQLGRLDLE